MTCIKYSYLIKENKGENITLKSKYLAMIISMCIYRSFPYVAEKPTYTFMYRHLYIICYEQGILLSDLIFLFNSMLCYIFLSININILEGL